MSSCKRASVSSKQSRTSNQSSSRPGYGKQGKPRRVLQSKKLPSSSSNDGKSSSTGTIKRKKPESQKKVTKSEYIFKNNLKRAEGCKNCGDGATIAQSTPITKDAVETVVSMSRRARQTAATRSQVQQHYRNENFQHSTESIADITNGMKKISLDPIKEDSEALSNESLFRVFHSEEDFENLDSKDNLTEIREFRQKNYFECHSAANRVQNKGSAINPPDHKCVYRFYLNDRLFPVPLCTDHTQEIRCIECLLPMNGQVHSDDRINGTIQAKVTLGKQSQDCMILLPIREPLIIHEKRKEVKEDKETLYFGLINLDKMGHSIFRPTLPNNSLALKYQKGYQEFSNPEEYSYHDVDKDDVIVI